MRKMGVGSESDAVDSATSEIGRFVELGERIARLRRRKGWDRAALARKLGVSRDRIAKWERGENAPPLEILVALRRLLGATLDELVTGRRGASPVVALSEEERERVARCLEEVRHLLENLTVPEGEGGEWVDGAGIDPDG
jgi:transcriptional regulator with XRE-family HTH domain